MSIMEQKLNKVLNSMGTKSYSSGKHNSKPKYTQEQALNKVYTDLEKKYPNYYNLPSDKQDRLFVQYANDSGLYKYI